ncbi:MAG: Crp/Fnr family transcriptional regulator [Methylomonas sp.]|jgi:CRP/FNR family cyclic AMP-dependent transcriptional regulator
MQTELVDTLMKLPFLAEQSEEALENLAKKIREVKYKKKSYIINEGEMTNSLYFIFSGKVRVYCTDENAKEVILTTLMAGSSFGILSLLSNRPRSATVQALENTVCGVIAKADFLQWVQLHPESALLLLCELSDKIQSLTDKVKTLALSGAYERFIQVLHDMCVSENDIRVIREAPTQEAFANMIGVRRETVSKFMGDLIKLGVLSKSKNGKILFILKKIPSRY